MNQQKPDHNQQYTQSHYDTTIQLMSPSKMIVESATMIFIISFMLASFVVLIWRGSTLSSTQILLGTFGLLFTFALAVRQFASFR